MSKKQKFPKKILEEAKTITGKRSRVVVDHILQHGSITTKDLESYGYKHAPRAIRDVRKQGLPIETFSTKNVNGTSIAGYRFGDPKDIRNDRLGGRQTFSKKFKAELFAKHEFKCAICITLYESRYLQVDHRILYEVGGDSGIQNIDEYMPICGACNRAKSWSCEHCTNWTDTKNPTVCLICYWASPEDYKHVALRKIRRLDIVWTEEEVQVFDMLHRLSTEQGVPIHDFVKAILQQTVSDEV